MPVRFVGYGSSLRGELARPIHAHRRTILVDIHPQIVAAREQHHHVRPILLDHALAQSLPDAGKALARVALVLRIAGGFTAALRSHEVHGKPARIQVMLEERPISRELARLGIGIAGAENP